MRGYRGDRRGSAVSPIQAGRAGDCGGLGATCFGIGGGGGFYIGMCLVRFLVIESLLKGMGSMYNLGDI